MSFAKDYAKKLLDGRWQKKRLEILQRDGFCCTICQRQHNVQIHHNWYLKNMEPWDYNGDQLVTLCNEHHEEIGELQEGLKRLLARSGPKVQRKVYDYLYGLLNEKKQAKEKCQFVSFSTITDGLYACEFKSSQKVDNGPLEMIADFDSGETVPWNVKFEFDLWSTNEEDRYWARCLFSQACRAVDVLTPKHADELCNIPLMVLIKDGAPQDFRKFPF